MIEQASLVIGEGNWAVKSDSLLGYKINNGKYYPREMSVVRATTGTRINEDGLVELVPYNLVEYSEDFSNSYWSKSNVTITTNNITAPNGTLTADKIAQTAGGFVNGNATGTGLNTYVFSVYLKAGSVSSVRLRESYYYGTSSVFNLTNGTATGTGIIESVGNGWYRCSLPQTYAAGETNLAFIIDITTVGDYYAWGAQLVEGSSALDYLPTTDRLDVARIDYSSGSAALLVEPQRTNLLTYSSSFDNAAWTKTDSTITANNTTSPSGIEDADKLVENNVNSLHAVSQTYSFTSGTAYTLSFYVKKSERTIIQALFSFQVTTAYCNFNSNTGVFNNQGFTSASMVDVGNGWYRCSVTITSSNTGTYSAFLSIETSINSARATGYTGNGTSGLFLWGAQLEVGSYATSYIPAQGSTVTRNADVISKTGIADLIGQTEGTIFWDVNVDILSASGHEDIFNIDNGAFGNTIYFIKASNSTFAAEVYNASSVQCSFTNIPIPAVGRYKLALAYKTNDFALYINGVLVGSDTSGSVGAMSRIQLGQTVFGPSTGYTNAAAIFKTRLTNAELATLTTI